MNGNRVQPDECAAGRLACAAPSDASTAIDAAGSEVPGPAWPRALQMAAWYTRPMTMMRRCSALHGDTFRLRIGRSSDGVFVTAPETLRQVFTAPSWQLSSAKASTQFVVIMGKRSVFLLDGDEHLQTRRLLLPGVHGEHLRTYEQRISDAADEIFARLPRDRTVCLQDAIADISAEVIIRCVFGEQDERERIELRRLCARFSRVLDWRSVLRLALYGPRRSVGPRREATLVSPLRQELLAVIARRRRDGAGEGVDVLSMLLAARDEQGAQLADAEVVDQLMSLLVAGTETTAASLGWAVDLLARHPHWLDFAVREAHGGTPPGTIDAIVKETLRIRPVVPVAARRVCEPIDLEGHRVPRGSIVLACTWLTHRRADLYPEPEAFRPERFLGRAPDPYAWIPFGGGVRRCLGASMVLTEMRVVLASLLRQAAISPAHGAGPTRERRQTLTFGPEGVRVVLRDAA